MKCVKKSSGPVTNKRAHTHKKGNSRTKIGNIIVSESDFFRRLKKNQSFETLKDFLLHNNPYFQSNIVITTFLVSNTCEIRFNDIIG